MIPTMSSLRRRIFGDIFTKPSQETSPDKGEKLTLVSTSKLKSLTKRRSKRRNGFVFGLGGLFGILVAAFFANRHDVISFDGLMDLNLDSLIDVIPAGVVKDAKDITVCFPAALWQCKTREAGADAAGRTSAASVKQSIMILSPSDYIYRGKASEPCIPSS